MSTGRRKSRCRISRRFSSLPPEPRPEHPVTVKVLETLGLTTSSSSTSRLRRRPLQRDFVRRTRGETVAFVGPSGVGKTTLVKLLVGLYRPQAGHIYYNGTAEDEIAIESLRERIGFVTQDAQLFSGSIRENLLFVHAGRHRRGMHGGASASVGREPAGACGPRARHGDRRGRRESFGRREAAALHRAGAAAEPQLLVFDEATSSLDSLTEEEISQTIRDVAASRDAITILIAHRLSTVLHADRIYVLERGRIVESGRHAELTERQRPVLRHVAAAGGRKQPRTECTVPGFTCGWFQVTRAVRERCAPRCRRERRAAEQRGFSPAWRGAVQVRLPC